jgi:2-amino-4-hydroxy-6-hydroxymethyldihydropteridine diphosphokinase
MPFSFLSLGSNIGYRRGYLTKAIRYLRQNCCEIVKVSNTYTTDPLEVIEQPYFTNCLIVIKTKLSPEELLYLCKRIEKEIGRFQTFKYGPRVIDIDILSYNYCMDKNSMEEIIGCSYKLDSANLVIPHPKCMERAFIKVLFGEVLGNPYKKLKGISRGEKIGHRTCRG